MNEYNIDFLFLDSEEALEFVQFLNSTDVSNEEKLRVIEKEMDQDVQFESDWYVDRVRWSDDSLIGDPVRVEVHLDKADRIENFRFIPSISSLEEESTMSREDLIVEVGRPELSEAIQKVAFENEFKWMSGDTSAIQAESPYLRFLKKGSITYFTSLDGLDHSVDYTLPDDWNGVVEWLEESDQLYTFKGYEVDVKPRANGIVKVEIGCTTIQLGDLEQAVGFVQRHNVEQFSISMGASSSVPVTRDELVELHSEVREAL